MGHSGWKAEWLIVRRHPLVWIVALVAIAFIALAAGNEAPADERELREALLRLNLFMPMFVLPFVAGALAPVFYLRETDHGLGEVFAAYPLSVRGWLTVRLGGLALLLAAICAVQQLAITAQLASVQPGMVDVMAAQNAKLMLLVHLPACLIWSVVLARVSSASGKAGMVYFAAGFGWIACVGLATLTGTPLVAGSFTAWEPLRTVMLVADPYAITALVNPPPIKGQPWSREIAIAVGRLGWLGLCLMLVRGIGAIPGYFAPTGRVAKPVSIRASARRSRAGHLALLLRWVVHDKFVLFAAVGWALLLFPEVFGGMHYAEQLATLDPDSRDALNRVMWDLVPPMGALLLLYTADRVSRMAPAGGMAELVAATPHASWRLVAARLVALWLVALGILAYTLAIVLVAQVAAQSPVQPREYLEQGGQSLPALLLSATAFVALHAVVRSRMAANLAGIALLVMGYSNLAASMGLHHPLWKPLAMPLVPPDHILGGGVNWTALGPFALFWAAVCGGAIVVAVCLHHRGLPYRQVTLRQAITRPIMVVAAGLLAGATWQGHAIDRTLEREFALVSADENAQRRADYEQRFGEWLGRPQPQVARVTSAIAFGAEGRSAELRLRMQLVNRSGSAIERVLVGRNLVDVEGRVALEGGHVERADRATGQTVFRLTAPMQPGEVRTLHFAARVTRAGLMGSEGLLILDPRFAALPVFQIAPVIGFQREFTLRDPRRRAQFGLPPVTIALPSQLGLPPADLARHQARFETVVSVPRGFHGVAVGELVHSWEDGERRFFRFRTDRAIRNAPMVFAVPWAAQRWQVGPTRLELHAPVPVAADDANVLAMRDTVDWLSRDVAPYPGRTLRLIAAPEFGSGGFAVPQAMLISYRRGFRARPEPQAGFSQAYRRTVHETAHQWFGHVLGHGIPEERAFLIESLAKYAELVMVERRYGKAATRALVAWESDRYARARLSPAQASVPLIDADDTEDMYSRATIAFACLRDRVGDDLILASLKHVADRARETGRPARSVDFVRHLRQTAGTTNGSLVDALLASEVPVSAVPGCAPVPTP